MKPTNNKPSQSSPIRKGKLSLEVIKKTAEELTKNQPQYWVVNKKIWKVLRDWWYDVIGPIELTRLQVVEAPAIEPEPQKGNYKVFAETIKAHIGESWQFEVTGDQLKLFFPQRNYGWQVAMHLKRYYGLSYRRVENGRNDTYVFFVEPTREELIVQLTSAESKVIELQGKLQTMKNANSQTYEALSKLEQSHIKVKEENTQLKSDLFYSKRSNIITLAFAIWAVITIIFKSVAL